MDHTDLTSALRRAEQRRDQVMAFLSHDMRSPLSSILALLELHGMDPEGNPATAVHTRIAALARQALHLNELFGSIAAAETRVLTCEAMDPSELCEAAIDDTWEISNARKVKIDLVPPPESAQPPLILADHGLLTQALGHLFSVMARHSTEGGRIAVNVTVQHATVSIDAAGQAAAGSTDWEQVLTHDAVTAGTPAVRAASTALPGAGRDIKRGGHKTTATSLELALVQIALARHGGRLVIEPTPTGARVTALLPRHHG